MNSRKKMLYFALRQMNGFSLEGSNHGDNRSIFSLIDALIRSAAGDAMNDCRKPLAAVLRIKTKIPNKKFMGCKLKSLQQTIETLFGDSKSLLSEQKFGGYNRSMLLEYLEICRRIFISKYIKAVKQSPSEKITVEDETYMARQLRLAYENGGKN